MPQEKIFSKIKRSVFKLFKVSAKPPVGPAVNLGDYMVRSDGNVYKATEVPANAKYGFNPANKGRLHVTNMDSGSLWSSKAYPAGTPLSVIEADIDKGRTLTLVTRAKADIDFKF